MASCKQCGAKVGCGCQLVNGLCSYCNSIAQKGTKKFKHVISQINKLCSMF